MTKNECPHQEIMDLIEIYSIAKRFVDIEIDIKIGDLRGFCDQLTAEDYGWA